jgi:hypothetical protein
MGKLISCQQSQKNDKKQIAIKGIAFFIQIKFLIKDCFI